uniref:(northern house mosquito) hypothetical protein n=1 Tax=Culex pipiens TaxID=7175 RepID=A0A8D8H3P5_CULPI
MCTVHGVNQRSKRNLERAHRIGVQKCCNRANIRSRKQQWFQEIRPNSSGGGFDQYQQRAQGQAATPEPHNHRLLRRLGDAGNEPVRESARVQPGSGHPDDPGRLQPCLPNDALRHHLVQRGHRQGKDEPEVLLSSRQQEHYARNQVRAGHRQLQRAQRDHQPRSQVSLVRQVEECGH